MNVLLRYLRQGPEGIAEFQDTELTTDAVKIGSAADRSIQLIGRDVAAKHAIVVVSGATAEIRSRRGARVVLNGRAVDTARLAVGDVIEVGKNRLRLLAPPAGFDLAIEVQVDASADASQYESAFRTELDQTWLSKRQGAWLLALLTLAAGLAIPLVSVYWHRAGAASPPYLPGDTFWSAGPLTPPHEHAVGRQCDACHQQLFIHVRDPACRKCHEGILDHVARRDLMLTTLGPTQRCAQCHLEHDAGASLLAIKEDGICTDCHAESRTRFGSLKVEPVSGFARVTHPAFTVTLQTPQSSGAGAAGFAWVASREPVASAREQSNLKFSHAQHLDPGKVTRASDGGALGCGDCHTLALDGEHFVPVTMAKHCASCHELSFDPSAPTRQLPHGKPLEAMLVIEDYYARKFSDPTMPVAAPRGAPARRVPDREALESAPAERCVEAAYLCAKRAALKEIKTQFELRGCVSCHVVNDTHAADMHDQYQVIPIRLTYDYFVDAHFSHKAHAIQKKKTGDEACLTCHAARASKQSADVMIPNIGNCLECHSDRYAKDKIEVRCVSCHAYHPAAIMARNRGEEQ